MNPDTDLKLLRELTSDEDGPSAEALARARAALLARAQGDSHSVERGSPRWSRFPQCAWYALVGLAGLERR